jgi:hypothetical protein
MAVARTTPSAGAASRWSRERQETKPGTVEVAVDSSTGASDSLSPTELDSAIEKIGDNMARGSPGIPATIASRQTPIASQRPIWARRRVSKIVWRT